MVSEEKACGSVILVAQIAHHTSTLASCNGMSRIDVENLLYWEFTYLLNWNQYRMIAGSVTVSCTPWNCQFTKFSLLCDLCYIGYEPQWMQVVYLLHVHLLSRMEPLSLKLFHVFVNCPNLHGTSYGSCILYMYDSKCTWQL